MPISPILTPFDHFHFRPPLGLLSSQDLTLCHNRFKVVRMNMIVQWLIFWYLASLAPPPLTCEYIHSIGHRHLHKKTKHIDIGRHNVHICEPPPIWVGVKLGFDGKICQSAVCGKSQPTGGKSLLRILIWELVHIHTDRCPDRTHGVRKFGQKRAGK